MKYKKKNTHNYITQKSNCWCGCIYLQFFPTYMCIHVQMPKHQSYACIYFLLFNPFKFILITWITCGLHFHTKYNKSKIALDQKHDHFAMFKSVYISECILLVNLFIQGVEINLLHFNNSKLRSNSASFVNVEQSVN